MSPQRRACSLQRLLDLGVYAPVGFLVSQDASVEELVAAGRKQLGFSRSLGRAALKTLAKGVKPYEGAAAPAQRPSGAQTATSSAANVESVKKTAAKAPAKKTAAKKTAAKAPAKKTTAKKTTAKKTAAKRGAVTGYDTMTAREVIAFTTKATAAQVAWLRTEEQAGKNRVTVLRALSAREAT